MASESEQERRETLADIVASMRHGTKLPGYWRSCDMNEILAYHADRIEAAWKREIAEIEANALAIGGVVEAARHTPGNAAAMRRALSDMCYAAMDIFRYFRGSQNKIIANLGVAFDKAKAALSAPARQCDVGTAEEQVVRFRDAMVHECLADEYCRCKDAARCFAQWAQLPYDAKEGAGK